MRNLVLLAIRNGYALAVLGLLGFGGALYVQHHGPGRSAWFHTTGEIAGNMQDLRADWTSYMEFGAENERLAAEVGKLLEELLALRGATGGRIDSSSHWTVLPGAVVSGTVGAARTLWLAKPGAVAGVEPGMGVLWNGYALGVVQEVSANFSRVMTLLHIDGGWSGRLGMTGASGVLSWDGRDARIMHLSGIPRHVHLQMGDTVFSTGFDLIFPAGLPMGIVEGSFDAEVPDFVDVRVRPLSDFSKVQHVQFFKVGLRGEKRQLMNLENAAQ
jgi:rod shape-determining protein MreC